jgi:hypothetical protein
MGWHEPSFGRSQRPPGTPDPLSSAGFQSPRDFAMPIAAFVLLVLLSAALPAPPLQATHVVIDTERAYMGAVTRGQVEYWLAPDKTWVSRRGRITITRRDLGVRWRLDPATKTYVEDKLTPPSPATAPAPAPGTEIHSARFDYEPEFDWTVAPGGRVTVAGRNCREFSAEGHADYAETRLRFAVGARVSVKTEPDVNQLLAAQSSYESVQRFLQEASRTRGNGCLMSYEESYEAAIAPTMATRVRISTLEIVQAPAKIFEVPDGFTRASQ